MSQPAPDRDWTHGPAKWAAVLTLGAASILGLSWSFFGRQPRPVYSPAIVYRDVVQERPAPAPALTRSEPSTAGPAAGAPAPEPQPAEPQPTALLAMPSEPVAGPKIETPPPKADTVARLININTAAAAELELLPGIGPALAARIVEHRTRHGRFRSVDELDHVSGIGPRTLEKIRPHATVK